MNTNNFVKWACTIVGFAALYQAAAQTSVINGSFETSFDGTTPAFWTLVGSQPPTLSTDAYDGTYSMDIAVTNTAGTANNSEIQQNTYNAGGGMVNAGEVYNFSFWAKQISAGVSYVQNYKVSWLDGTGAIVSDGTGFIPFTGGNGTWTQITSTNIAVPTGAVAAFIQIFGATGAVTNGFGEVLIDEVTFSTNGVSSGGGGGGSTNSVQASITAGSEVSWASTSGAQDQVQRASSAGGPWSNLGSSIAGVSGTGSIFDPAKGYFYQVIETSGGGGGGNPISNGGFESGTGTASATDWNFVGMAPTRSTNSHSGSYSVRCYAQTDQGGPAQSSEANQKTVQNTLQNTAVVPGQTYSISFWVQDISTNEIPATYTTTGVQGQALMYWTDASGNNLGGPTFFGPFLAGNHAAWTQIQHANLVAPANAAGVLIQLLGQTGANPKTAGGMYYDDVTLTTGSGGGGTGTTNTLTATVQPGVQISWSSGTGTNYQVQSSSTVSDGGTPWANFGSVISGDGTTKSVFDTATGTSKFYQVLTQ